MVPPPRRHIPLSGRNRRTLHFLLETQPKTRAEEGELPRVACCFWGRRCAAWHRKGGDSVIPSRVLQAFRERATFIALGELFAPFQAFLLTLRDLCRATPFNVLRQLGNFCQLPLSGRSTLLDQQCAGKSALVVDFAHGDTLVGTCRHTCQSCRRRKPTRHIMADWRTCLVSTCTNWPCLTAGPTASFRVASFSPEVEAFLDLCGTPKDDGLI